MLIHIIGHSLGAHAAGYAGSRIKPQISRITGLDPAGPYFEFTDPKVRLDPTDAKFVDIIHTDGQSHLQLGLGLLQPIGHVDFYPNGGKEQPSCPKMSGKVFNTIINAFDADGNTTFFITSISLIRTGIHSILALSSFFSKALRTYQVEYSSKKINV
jgi:hypothetical protein